MTTSARRLTALLFAGLLTATLARGEGLVHNVSVSNFDFDQADLDITVGDTVVWTWAGGLHNVESGVGGTADGNFTSGAPTSANGTMFSVTFDAAFLAANPMPGDTYPYYCIVHLDFGMTGSITVEDVPSSSLTYGNCNSPANSLTIVSGAPILGTTLTLGVDDPVPGSSPVGTSLAGLVLALAPDPNFPCGTPLPFVGTNGGLGDLLFSVVPPNPLFVLVDPTPWAGPGVPTNFSLPLPADPAFLGIDLFFQGAVGSSAQTRLTEGLRTTLGSI